MSVNKVILVGRLGQNPEIRYTPSGAAVTNFSVATSESWNDKSGQKQEKTEWHRIVVWGKMAETCNQYLAKGRQVYLEGKLQTRQWQDKDGQTKYTTEVQALTVQFLGGNAQNNAQPGSSPSMDRGAGGGGREFSSFNGGNSSNGGMGGGMGNDMGILPPNGGGQEPSYSHSSGGDSSFTEDDIPF